jgi:hypothetical protein
MTTKRGKRTTKKVKGLKAKSLSAAKAKGVRGGSLGVGIRYGTKQIIPTRSIKTN